MKHIIRTLCIVIGLIGLQTSQSWAQYTHYTQFSWNTSLPMGSTKDYISKYSVRGVGFEWGGFVKPKVSAALSLSWNVFYESKPRGTYTFEGGLTATGTPYNYINTIPIISKVHYYFKDPLKTSPYVGLGIGTTWQKQNTDFGINSFYRDGWMFGLFPEVGFNYQVNPVSAINFNVRYNYNFETNQVLELSYMGFNLGYVWRY